MVFPKDPEKIRQEVRESELGLEEQLIVFCLIHAQTHKDVLLFPSHCPDKETEDQIRAPPL